MTPEDRGFVMPAADAFAAGFDVYPGRRYEDGVVRAEDLPLVEEAPLALSYNGEPHAVMLMTPTDLEDFAVGFSLSEGIVETFGEIESIEIVPSREGIGAMLRIPLERAARLLDRRRAMTGHGGCGLCGVEDLQAAMPAPRVVTRRFQAGPQALQQAMASLPSLQALGARTGASHAAAFAGPDGKVVAIREDAGRHNALDKLIGHLAQRGIAPASGMLLLSSRGSCELALKASAVGFELMATVSAPTGLAVRIAQAAGMTLIGFAREGRFTCYAGEQRIGG